MILKKQFSTYHQASSHSLPVNSSDSPRLPYEFAKLVQDKGISGLDYSGWEYQNLEIFRFGRNHSCLRGVEKEKSATHINTTSQNVGNR